MTRCSVTPSVAALALVAVVGCSSAPANTSYGNQAAPSASQHFSGEQGKTSEQVLTDAGLALNSATSVHVRLTNSSLGRPTADLSFVGTDVHGSFAKDGFSAQIRRAANATFIKADRSYWAHSLSRSGVISMGPDVSPALDALADKWVKLGEAETAPFDRFRISTFAAEINNGSGDNTVAVTQSTYEGQPIVQAKDATGATIDVAATGKPYPLHVFYANRGNGEVFFEGYDRVQPISVPADATDGAQAVADAARAVNGG